MRAPWEELEVRQFWVNSGGGFLTRFGLVGRGSLPFWTSCIGSPAPRRYWLRRREIEKGLSLTRTGVLATWEVLPGAADAAPLGLASGLGFAFFSKMMKFSRSFLMPMPRRAIIIAAAWCRFKL